MFSDVMSLLLLLLFLFLFFQFFCLLLSRASP
ncbi:transporter [Salmonella enterica]|nr:transporter [Salmonella enterica]EDU6784846.1 transporter [Salmonella enterica subsp. enterica serovar Gaminara]EAO4223927.1 transporter [Salmonella enterica]EAR9571300.1 transporter [Salmonella enterica]EAT6444172.1 transporter [Salmonella enterica]